MTISGKTFTAIILFSLLAATSMAEINSPMVLPSNNQSCPTSYPIEYSLLFETCNPKYNSETYYSSGLQQLSYIYLGFSLLYLVVLGVWISICLKINPSVCRIHFLMGGLIVMKSLTLICSASERYLENVTGSRNGSDLLYYVRQIIISVRLLIVGLLIGNGWPHLKPILQEIDKVVLMSVIPQQVVGNVASIVMGETNQLSLLVDCVGQFEMLIPYICSLLSTLGIRPRASSRLRLFRGFCVIVAIYLANIRVSILIRNAGNFKLNGVDAYNYLLKSNVAVEVIGLVFYEVSFKMFRNFFRGVE